MHHTSSFAGLLALALVACSGENATLSAQDKAKFTAELILNEAECVGYVQKLTAPIADEKLVEQIYQAAKRAHCLKPDV